MSWVLTHVGSPPIAALPIKPTGVDLTESLQRTAWRAPFTVHILPRHQPLHPRCEPRGTPRPSRKAVREGLPKRSPSVITQGRPVDLAPSLGLLRRFVPPSLVTFAVLRGARVSIGPALPARREERPAVGADTPRPVLPVTRRSAAASARFAWAPAIPCARLPGSSHSLRCSACESPRRSPSP